MSYRLGRREREEDKRETERMAQIQGLREELHTARQANDWMTIARAQSRLAAVETNRARKILLARGRWWRPNTEMRRVPLSPEFSSEAEAMCIELPTKREAFPKTSLRDWFRKGESKGVVLP